LKKTKLAIEGIIKVKKILDAVSLVIVLSIVITSIFSSMVVTASGKSSTASPAEAHSVVPQIKMIYDNKAYDMSTFVLANNGVMKKITIPTSSTTGDGSNPPVHLQLGTTVHFEFDKEPTKVNAFLIDIEAQPVELYAQRQIGPSDFQVVGPEGILNYEIHAYFADGQYTSQYIPANVTGGASPTVRNFSINGTSADNGYIALADKPDCNKADRLHAVEITSSSQNNTSSPVTVIDNNLKTSWMVNGTDVKSFVKTSVDDAGQNTRSANNASPWLQLDLGADKTVCNIGIAFPNGDKSIEHFKVQTSADGKHFTDVGIAESYPLDAGGQLFTFPDMPDKVRYVRISDVGNLLSGETEIAEFMAAGK
jgi:F5/8 type C domain